MDFKKLNRALAIALCATTLVPGLVSAKEFKDVKAKGPYGWAYTYIDVLSDKGIINGYEDDTYRPENKVSIEEVFKLLVGVINPDGKEVKEAKGKYEKICKNNGVSNWAIESMSVALNRGIVTEGQLKEMSSNKMFGPNRVAYPDREAIAIFFALGLDLPSNGDESLLKHKDKNSMSQLLKSYLPSLVKEGIFSATGSDGNFEGRRAIKRSEMAKITKTSYDFAKNVDLSLKKEEKEAAGKVILSTKLNNVDQIIIEKDDKRSNFKVDSKTEFVMGDKKIKMSDVKIGQEVKIKYYKTNDDTITGIATKVDVEKTESALVGYIDRVYKDDNEFKIKYTDNDKDIDFESTKEIKTDELERFKLAKDVDIYRYGKKIKIKDLEEDDLILFTANKDKEILEAKVYPKHGEVKGEIKKIEECTSSKREKITLKLDDKKEYTFYGKVDVRSRDELFRDLKKGDDVTLQLDYMIVSEIGEKSNKERGYVVGKVIKTYDDKIKVETSSGEKKFYIEKDDLKIENKKNPSLKLTVSDLKNDYVMIEPGKDEIAKRIVVLDRDMAVDIVAQLVERDGRNYTFKVLDSSEFDENSKGDELEFRVSSSEAMDKFDQFDILRIVGFKKENGNDLEEVTLYRIDDAKSEIKDKDLKDYKYDFENEKVDNNSNDRTWK